MGSVADQNKPGGGVARGLRNVALSIALVGWAAWRRDQQRERERLARIPEVAGPDADPTVVDALVEDQPDPGTAESVGIDPAAAVGADDGSEPEVITDRRRARRVRRREGRSHPAGIDGLLVGAGSGDAVLGDDLPVIDPAAAVAPEPEPPVLVPDLPAEERDEIAPVEPEPDREVDRSLHVVEVPAEAPAEFVRDFLLDVQHLLNSGVATKEQAAAAEDRRDPDWVPDAWLPPEESRSRGSRRRVEADGPLPVVYPPRLPQRRKEKEPTVRRTRLARYSLVVVLIGSCAALPWVVPQVPTWFASVVPEGASDPPRTGPTILPAPTPTVSGPTSPSAEPTAQAGPLGAAGRPLEVWVPRLKVRSPVVPISGQSGTLLPPDDAQILGWWQEGSRAGATNGSAVVTGHTISTGGGAFDNLGKLATGDRVRVRTAAGWITYEVQRSRDYTVEELAENAEDIFDRGGQSRLVLITCSDFNGTVYLSNAVVFATPVGDEPFVVPGNPDLEVPDGGLGRPWDGPGGNTGVDPGVQLSDKPF